MKQNSNEISEFPDWIQNVMWFQITDTDKIAILLHGKSFLLKTKVKHDFVFK